MLFRTRSKLYFTAFTMGILIMDVTGIVFRLYEIIAGAVLGFFATFFMVIMFMWYKKKNYPNIVRIRERRGNTDVIDGDIARRIVQADGTTVYEMYYRMEQIKPPNFEDMNTGVDGRNYIDLYQLEDKSYLPIKFKLDGKTNPITTTGGQEDLHFHARQLEKAVLESAGKQTWIQEFAPMILIIVTGVIIMGILWISIPPLLQIAQSVGESVKTTGEMQAELLAFLNASATSYPYTEPPPMVNISY